MRKRAVLLATFILALAWAQLSDPLHPRFAARLELAVLDPTGRPAPARVYLFKDGRPFRLNPVDALLPLRVDLFYRERLWRQAARPQVLEITAHDESHFILLDGAAVFDLPAGDYRLEAYRGIFYAPAVQEFRLVAEEKRKLELKPAPLDLDRQKQWLSSDDHIHLVRAREDDDVFLRWLQAEDLSVGNFLQLQRQSDAATQYGFGDGAEARRPGFSIRSGIEARSHFYGHVNLLGPREILRPLSVGTVYANSPEAYPFPRVLFDRARGLGATVGYAHFDGSQKHSTLLMDLALGAIDFIEVFQFGVLKAEPWYRLLNAGLRVTGVAGSDFPVPLNNRRPWPRSIPLLGPERTLVKASPGASAYQSWAAGVRAGEVIVSNGPLLEFEVNGRGPGAVIEWQGDSTTAAGVAHVVCHRPIQQLEIVVNGNVAAAATLSPNATRASLPFKIPLTESSWIAARAKARNQEGEPELWAHSNPAYLLHDGRPVRIASDREAVLRQWEQEMQYYRSSELTFADERHRRELIEKAEAALEALKK